MIKFIVILICLGAIMIKESPEAKPQDLQNAALLAFAQVKDTFDNGAAAKDTREFEFMGAKVKNDMQIGFGDAIKRKRSVFSTSSSSSSSSSESKERIKRSPDFENHSGHIVNSNENFVRAKRSIEEANIENNNYENGEEYDYGTDPAFEYSSFETSEPTDYSYYLESVDVEKASSELQKVKRSINLEGLKEDMEIIYLSFY
ncbi:uncharacterized protein ACRADG_007801 [Cochliomyia hominivorax]